MKNKLSGVIVSIVTPFTDSKFREDYLIENIMNLNQTAVNGYLALGGNGESQSLCHSEKERILKIVADRKKDKLLLVGISSESTKNLLEQAKWAADHGVDVLRIPSPHYNPKHVSNDVILRFFTEVANESPLPILLYNAPAVIGVTLSPSIINELASHPNILGIKDSSLTSLYGYLNIRRDNPDFKIFAGSASFFLPALMAGAVGGDMSLANYLPEACCTLFESFKNGQIDKAQNLHGRLLSVNSAVSGKWGFAGVKTAMSLLGFKGGEPRSPYGLPDNIGTEAIREILIKEGFLG